MTPTPDLTQLFNTLYGTRALEQVVYVTSTDSTAAALLCMVSLMGLGLLGLALVVLWQNTWGKQS